MKIEYTDMTTGEPCDPLDGTMSVIELTREHKRRYVLRTSAGAVILRPMPLRMKRVIDAARYALFPDMRDMEQELALLAPGLKGIPVEQWEPEVRTRVEEIAHYKQIHDMDALGVIVSPVLTDMEDYEELLEELTEDERMALALAVRELAAPRPPSQVDATALELAEKYGIELVDADLLENLTVSQ